ncbi:MAG: hypothetical protein KatS3mg096_813 [Candidatus Parcubacteria bacterium]|nr:MAG: hypothetical protein KatS3mg096_813 [Candidatus Parcubacteria bacterium]
MITKEEDKNFIKLIEIKEDNQKQTILEFPKEQGIVLSDKLKVVDYLIKHMNFEILSTHFNLNNQKVVFVLIKRS